jgi:two-component sensor histidine kinase
LHNNKKKNKLLNIKNEIISDKIQLVEEQKIELYQSLQERELLLKEIHHRVKNNLQIIMSLLNIQASRSEDISIENFLEKAQSRISSMSLIHQSLYENETIDSIDFEVYTKQLAFNLIHLFGVDDKNIQLEINAKDIFLDLQTAISLGLILNELFTNTLKYAFTDYKNAKISVTIETIDNEQFNLIFSDNGNGYLEKNNSRKSLGLELIELLALQLGGAIEKQDCKGTKYFMNFKKQI